MDNNVNVFDSKSASVIAELAHFFTTFNELLNMELSEEAKNIISLTLYDLLDNSKDDEVTISNDDWNCPVDDDLPNEYAQCQCSKPVKTHEHSKMFNGYADLMDGSSKRITGKCLYKAFKDYTKRYPGLNMSPEGYLKNILIEELTQIGYDTESGPMYVFLMNVWHLDFQRRYFNGKPSDNPYTAESSIKEQFGVNIKLDSLLHNDTTKGHNLSRSALLGLPVYADGSMSLMNLLSYYCELISEFMLEAAKDE